MPRLIAAGYRGARARPRPLAGRGVLVGEPRRDRRGRRRRSRTRSREAVARRRRALLPRPLDVGAARGSKTPTAVPPRPSRRRRPRHPSVASSISAGCTRTGVTLSPHLRSRVEVGRGLPRQRACRRSCCRPGVVIGSGSASFEMVRHLTEVLPYMPAPKWVRNRIQPIAVRDVLHYLLGAARVPRRRQPRRRHRRAGRAAVRADDERLRASRRGCAQRPIAALPVLTPRLASHWVNLVTPIPRVDRAARSSSRCRTSAS